MVRPTDQETTAWKRQLITLAERGPHSMSEGGPMEKHQGRSQAEREGSIVGHDG